MGDFAGLIRFDKEAIDPGTAMRLSQSVLSKKNPLVWRPDRFSLFVQGEAAAATQGTTEPPVRLPPGQVLLADAWLQEPMEVAGALGLPFRISSRALIAAACASWSLERAIDRLHGDVAIALWDGEVRRLTLARDALGGRPIYYTVNPRFVLFATSLQTMLAMPQASRDLDPVVLAHTMTIALQDQEQTIYRHIRRAPPGGFAIFHQGRCTTSRYYTADRIAAVRLPSDNQYVEAAREILDRTVSCRLPSRAPYASDLSGGFDSGGVTATAARLLGSNPLTAYTRVASAGHPDRGFDERRLAGKLVERYGNIEWVIIDDARESPRDAHPEDEAGALLVPRMGSFNTTWFESLRLAVDRSGASVLLTGGCGNLTLSHPGAPQAAEKFRAGKWVGAIRDLRLEAAMRKEPLFRTAASAIYHGMAPRALKRWWVRRRDGQRPWLAYSVVSREFLDALDYETHARSVGHDVPFALPYDEKETRLRLLQGQRGTDFRGFILRKWRHVGRDPYRDRRLIDFCLGIPADQYWRDGQSRWLARRALADRVPAETLAQQRSGRQSPEWYAIASRRLADMAEAIDRIARSPLASQVLDVPRMRSLLADWPKDAAAADQSISLHGHALQRAIAMGGFLRWHEGRND